VRSACVGHASPREVIIMAKGSAGKAGGARKAGKPSAKGKAVGTSGGRGAGSAGGPIVSTSGKSGGGGK
jgi:hypothetical protein